MCGFNWGHTLLDVNGLNVPASRHIAGEPQQMIYSMVATRRRGRVQTLEGMGDVCAGGMLAVCARFDPQFVQGLKTGV